MAINSGAYWVRWAKDNIPDSSQIIDLRLGFRESVQAFIDALEAANATVLIESTRRSVKRAYLFHWSWRIATEDVRASEAIEMDGVDIQWDHGNDAESKNGALEMVRGFRLALPPRSTVAPSMTSNHIRGEAIDMKICWLGDMSVQDADGNMRTVPFKTNVNTNKELHKVGASYGVMKHLNDAPHWSLNGR
ncbi:hypothetical protein E8K88_13080 [Lampropedia aestuarii]|uniref:Peptidoglycan-binding domain-containing protein n=1 Tax=Lampropedia aestuarii TaxID=2562762 RepID=A0A4S5BMR4_9BURK|nr:hypothetical protein [Lampropedia aestuarii]THJ32175.1 hypothetical protein E8K88_13080 [Lampropedia aestuarii]